MTARFMHDESYKDAQALAEDLRAGLRVLAKGGSVSPSDLIFETPETLHALRKRGLDDLPTAPLEEQVAEAIVKTVDQLPARDREAAQILFGLAPSTQGTRLGNRRERAAEVLLITAGTFRNRQEGRILDKVAQELAVMLLYGASAGQEPGGEDPSPANVLLIHRADSFGVRVVSRLVESFGLKPIRWEQALHRAGFSSPSVVDRFRSSLDLAQGVIVVFEGGPGDVRDNLALEAGIALGLAPARTVIVQLGDQDPLGDVAGVNVLRLRNTAESLTALRSALRAAGCAVSLQPEDGKKVKEKGEREPPPDRGFDVGWFRWTPEKAKSDVYADIAQAVCDFVPVDAAAGRAAAAWLKKESLQEYPGVVTWLRVRDGQVAGFIALQTGSLRIGSQRRGSKVVGATYLKWFAKHRDAELQGNVLFKQAFNLAAKAGRELGISALAVEAFDEETARVLEARYAFLQVGRKPGLLWLPLAPSQEPEGVQVDI